MLFFKSILNFRHKTPRSERRGPPRFLVYPQFPVKVLLTMVDCDATGRAVNAKEGKGSGWPAKLLNLSISGARLELPLAVEAQRHDLCQLEFDVQGYSLTLPGRIAYQDKTRDSQQYGIVIDTPDLDTLRTFEQLVLLVAFGVSLQLTQPLMADEIGYLFERYDGFRSSYLKVWRSVDTQKVMIFEFALIDCIVRGHADRPGVQCLYGTDASTAKAATPDQAAEIKRLYEWIVLNLAPTLPEDLRDFLVSHAA